MEVKAFWTGSCVFCVEGENFALLNRLRQFRLRDIEVGNGRIVFACSLQQRRAVEQVLRRETFTVKENKNIFGFLNFFYTRLILTVAVIVSVVMLAVLDGFIFSIDVMGVENEQRNQVMQYIEESNLRPFMRKQQEYAEEVARGVTAHFDFVGHAAAKIVGSRLIFNIHRAEVADDIGMNSNIVASADGVIVGILVVSGRALVGVGDIVRKGDTLIIGEYQIGEEQFAPCRAVGEVRLSVAYSESAVVFSTTQVLTSSGATKTVRDVYCVGLGGKKPHDVGFEYYSTEEKVTEWTLFFKFALVETTYRELVMQTRQVDLKIHRHTVASELLSRLKVNANTDEFEKVDTFFTELTADSIAVEVVGTLTVIVN